MPEKVFQMGGQKRRELPYCNTGKKLEGLIAIDSRESRGERNKNKIREIKKETREEGGKRIRKQKRCPEGSSVLMGGGVANLQTRG